MTDDVINNGKVINVLTVYKFAAFVDNELVFINNCDERMAAILNSNPVFEEIL